MAEIERAIPAARVIHLIREGRDVAVSMHAVSRQYDEWGGSRSARACVGRWRADVARSAECVGRPGHAFVAYERLVAAPEEVLGALVAWADLAADVGEVEAMLRDYERRAETLANGEPWKSMAGPIEHRAAQATELLSPEELKLIDDAVAEEGALAARFPFL